MGPGRQGLPRRPRSGPCARRPSTAVLGSGRGILEARSGCGPVKPIVRIGSKQNMKDTRYQIPANQSDPIADVCYPQACGGRSPSQPFAFDSISALRKGCAQRAVPIAGSGA